MESKEAQGSSIGDEVEKNSELSTMSGDNFLRAPSLEFDCLPDDVRLVMGNYISYDKIDHTRRALLGEQRITLCLAQQANLRLGSCWHFGCLSPEAEWKSSLELKVDRQYLIEDYQGCLDLLSRENSPYCPIVIEVLVFRLELSSKGFSKALDDLQNLLTMIPGHLRSVQNVVFAFEKHAFAYFAFKDVIDNVTSVRQIVDRLLALTQILDDLRFCWATNPTPNIRMLLDHYLLRDVKPGSEKYLSKFVINCHDRDLFDAVHPTLESSKLKWIYYLENLDDMKHVNQKIARSCHAIHLDASNYDDTRNLFDNFRQAFCLQDNPSIERIALYCSMYGSIFSLPEPSVPLVDNTPQSALIELNLEGDNNSLDLRKLNNGFFPNLTHLSFRYGNISGQLDSHRVPRLKTLILEPGSKFDRARSEVDSLVREHTQFIMRANRPWQLVVAQANGGWSLASYDEPLLHPHDEVKDDAIHPHSLPFIQELMLVANRFENINEWQSKLNGDVSPEEAPKDHSDRLLVWAPQCVQNITAFGPLVGRSFQLTILPTQPGQTRILSSLTSHYVAVELHGNALPELKSLDVNGKVIVTLSGTFPQLSMLSLKGVDIFTPCEVDAPLLETFKCQDVIRGNNLSLQLLPRLSYLHITPHEARPRLCPNIQFEGDNIGLSRLNHVVFGKNMTLSRYFDRCQLNHVSHLELALDASRNLPVLLNGNTEWQCETLTVHFYGRESDGEHPVYIPLVVVLLPLPNLKKLTVTQEHCQVLLGGEMPQLTHCTVPSSILVGQNLKCPVLRCVSVTGHLSDSDKQKWLDRATYGMIGAQPEWVYFESDSEAKRISWDVAPSANGVSSFAEPLEDVD